MLQCIHCKANLAIIIHPKLTNTKSIRKLVTTYQEKLASTHSPSCFFRLDAEQYINDDNNTLQQDNTTKNSSTGCVVPPLLIPILPSNVLKLLESPSPLPLLKDRFVALMEILLKDAEIREGEPPKWEFPPFVLPKDILQFDGADDKSVIVSSTNEDNISTSPTTGSPKKSPSRKRRLLARLAFDPHHPETAIGYEKENLLSKLEKLFMPPENETEEIRAQTRAQGAWEDFYEVIVALALFGWTPYTTNSTNNMLQSSAENSKDVPVVCLECSVCLSKMDFQMHEYDHHHHHHRTSPNKKKVLYGSDSEEELDEEAHNTTPPRKRRKLGQHPHHYVTKINPVLSHRFYCPIVCGFPRDGARRGDPLWKIIASKLLHTKKEQPNCGDDQQGVDVENDDGEVAMERILQLLDAGVSSRVSAGQQQM